MKVVRLVLLLIISGSLLLILHYKLQQKEIVECRNIEAALTQRKGDSDVQLLNKYYCKGADWLPIKEFRHYYNLKVNYHRLYYFISGQEIECSVAQEPIFDEKDHLLIENFFCNGWNFVVVQSDITKKWGQDWDEKDKLKADDFIKRFSFRKSIIFQIIPEGNLVNKRGIYKLKLFTSKISPTLSIINGKLVHLTIENGFIRIDSIYVDEIKK